MLCLVKKSKNPMIAARKRAELEKRLQVCVCGISTCHIIVVQDVSGKLGSGSKPKTPTASKG